jgi:hypothetical protein
MRTHLTKPRRRLYPRAAPARGFAGDARPLGGRKVRVVAAVSGDVAGAKEAKLTLAEESELLCGQSDPVRLEISDGRITCSKRFGHQGEASRGCNPPLATTVTLPHRPHSWTCSSSRVIRSASCVLWLHHEQGTGRRLGVLLLILARWCARHECGWEDAAIILAVTAAPCVIAAATITVAVALDVVTAPYQLWKGYFPCRIGRVNGRGRAAG